MSVATASLRFDLESNENHPDTRKKTRRVFPFEAVKGTHHLFAVDVSSRYGNWTTDKKWLVKHLVTGKLIRYLLL